MGRLFWKFILVRIFGWEIKGYEAVNTKKCVLVVAPHTSYWDFPVGIGVRSILNIKANFLIKSELYKFAPLGWFLSKIGGIPVDRGSKNSSLIDQVVKVFNEREEVCLALAPEGTRSKVNQWKTGFYRIAKGAKVPIVLVVFDFGNKVVDFMEEYHTNDNDMKAEIDYLRSRFFGIKGKHPEQGVH